MTTKGMRTRDAQNRNRERGRKTSLLSSTGEHATLYLYLHLLPLPLPLPLPPTSALYPFPSTTNLCPLPSTITLCFNSHSLPPAPCPLSPTFYYQSRLAPAFCFLPLAPGPLPPTRAPPLPKPTGPHDLVNREGAARFPIRLLLSHYQEARTIST